MGIAYPCVGCTKPVKSNQRGLQCTLCSNWVHASCGGISIREYDNPSHNFLDWICSKCIFSFLPVNAFEKQEEQIGNNSPVNTNVSNTTGILNLSENLVFDELKQKGLKILHLNVRSLLRNICEIRQLLRQNDVHILSVNETWLDNSILTNEINIDNFQIVRKDRNRNGGGTAVYIRSNLQFELLNHDSLNYLEALPILIHPSKCAKPFIFLSWYRPPNSKSDVLNHYEELISFLDGFNHNIIVMGDLNCDLMKHSLSSDTKRLNQINEIYSLIQLNTTKFTRVCQNSKSLIDHMICNSKEMIKSHGVLCTGISDHYLCYVIWKSNNEHKTPRIVTYRKLNNLSLDSYLEDLTSQNWQLVHDCTCLDDAVEVWQNLLLEVVNRHMPCRQKRVKSKPSPWMTSDILKIIKERDKLKAKAHKAKFNFVNENNLAIKNDKQTFYDNLWKEYRMLRNKVTTKIRKARRSFYSNKLSAAENPNQIWNILKDVMPNKTPSQTGHSNSNTISQANQFNDYFANVGSELASKIPQVSRDANQSKIVESATFDFVSVTEDQVLKTLMGMKNKKSVGLDGISMHILKMSTPVIIPSLTHLFNKSLAEGVFPSQWKMTKLIPLLKSGDKSCPANYRPIAILPCVSKVLEKIVQKQLTSYLKTNNLLSTAQSGFRDKHSTTTALLRVTDDWLLAIDRGLYTGAIFIDLKKAFDTVDPFIMLQKLKRMGFSDASLAWFRSYLTNRKVGTLFNSSMSNFSDIHHGVPQGSILGPVLFVIYINDIVRQVKNCRIHLYADDTVLYFSHKDPIHIENVLNNDFKRVYDWMCVNKLSLNLQKTESFLIGSRSSLSRRNTLRIKLCGQEIKHKETVKYLGVTLDQQLKWDVHINALCGKTCKLVKYFGRLRHVLNETCLKLLYNSLVLPLFDYADLIYDSATMKYTSQLQKIQNRAGRIILGINPYKHVSNHEIHQILNWDSLNTRRKKHLNSMVFKCLHDYSAPYLKESFNFMSRNYSLRSNGTLSLPKPKTEYCRRMFSYRGACYYNELPSEPKCCSSVTSFNKMIDDVIPKYL